MASPEQPQANIYGVSPYQPQSQPFAGNDNQMNAQKLEN